VLPTVEELGIGFVPWNPLGQGYLTGKVDATMTFDSNSDLRTTFPRSTPEARKANQPAVDLLRAEIELTSADLREVESAFAKTTVQGAGLSEEHMKLIDR
jgi:aryl-alcohol dehydrogenase-like predicted oxidoreductase